MQQENVQLVKKAIRSLTHRKTPLGPDHVYDERTGRFGISGVLATLAGMPKNAVTVDNAVDVEDYVQQEYGIHYTDQQVLGDYLRVARSNRRNARAVAELQALLNNVE